MREHWKERGRERAHGQTIKEGSMYGCDTKVFGPFHNKVTERAVNDSAINSAISRDDVEFNAAIAFLHDCGEIVHFEDASLRCVLIYRLIILSKNQLCQSTKLSLCGSIKL